MTCKEEDEKYCAGEMDNRSICATAKEMRSEALEIVREVNVVFICLINWSVMKGRFLTCLTFYSLLVPLTYSNDLFCLTRRVKCCMENG